MNKIENLTIKGFKSIQQAELNLTNLNVLIGANGAGKSNLITFFQMLNYLESGYLQGYVADNGYADSFLFLGSKKTPFIDAEIKFSTDKGSNYYHLRLSHTAGGKLIFLNEEVSFCQRDREMDTAPRSNLGVGHQETALNENHTSKIIQQTTNVIKNIIKYWRVFQFHDTSKTASIKQPCYIHDDNYLRSDAGNLAAFLYRLKKEKNKYYQRIISTIRLIAPFFHDFILEPKGNYIYLNWQGKNQLEYVFGSHQLSDGTLRMMALITLLLQPKLPNTIIIDEPELGLHPYAIEVLVSLLLSAAEKTQILLSTQSESIISLLEPEHVIVVDKDKNGASTFKRLNTDELNEWLNDYTLGELWNKNLFGGKPQ